MANTTPRQYRVHEDTAQAIKELQAKTGKGTADILKAWQLAFEKVGADEQGKDIVKGRIGAIEGHFTAVIAELEAMARDLQAHHDGDLLTIEELSKKNADLEAKVQEQEKELQEKAKTISSLETKVKETEESLVKLAESNERLKNKIMKKLEEKL